MLPILIVPDAWYGEDALVGDVVRRAVVPSKSLKDRPTGRNGLRLAWRRRCRLPSVVRLNFVSFPVARSSYADNLGDLEALVGVVLRRRLHAIKADARRGLIAAARAATGRTSQSKAMHRDAAAWLLWSMSWRGLSTPPQVVAPQLHPPTLLVRWWIGLPGSIRSEPARLLAPALLHLLDRTFRFWREVASRMRSFGWYFWDPQLVRFVFRPAAAAYHQGKCVQLTALRRKGRGKSRVWAHRASSRTA